MISYKKIQRQKGVHLSLESQEISSKQNQMKTLLNNHKYGTGSKSIQKQISTNQNFYDNSALAESQTLNVRCLDFAGADTLMDVFCQII